MTVREFFGHPVTQIALWALVFGIILFVLLWFFGVVNAGEGAAIATPQDSTSEVGSFDIAAPQSLPFDTSFTLKKSFGSGAVVSLVAEDGTGAPVSAAVRSRTGKDVAFRIQNVPRLGAWVSMSFVPTPASGSMNQRISLMELPDGKMALGLMGTVGTGTTRAAYFLSNDNGGFKKPVDFGGAAFIFAHDFLVNTNDNKPMLAVFDNATGPTFTFRKADSIDGTSFTGTGGVSIAAQSMEASTDTIAAEDDIRLLMVNKKPMMFFMSSVTDSVVWCKAASDAHGSSWGSAVQVCDSDAVDVVSTLSVAIVNGRAAVAYVVDNSGPVHFCRASNDAGTTWNTKVVLTATSGADANNVAFQLVDGVKNSAGVRVPAIVYIGETTLDVNVCISDDVDGVVWPATETTFPNSTILDDAGVYEDTSIGNLGAIVDPDGNLIVIAVATDRNHFLVWKCDGATPPSEPHVLDICNDQFTTSSKGAHAFGFKVIHGKPTMAWVETEAAARVRWCQFEDYNMNQMIHCEYTVHA